jgi:hypothetical protein
MLSTDTYQWRCELDNWPGSIPEFERPWEGDTDYYTVLWNKKRALVSAYSTFGPCRSTSRVVGRCVGERAPKWLSALSGQQAAASTVPIGVECLQTVCCRYNSQVSDVFLVPCRTEMLDKWYLYVSTVWSMSLPRECLTSGLYYE